MAIGIDFEDVRHDRNDQAWTDDNYEGGGEYEEDDQDATGVGELDELADVTPYVDRARRGAAPLGLPTLPPPSRAGGGSEKDGEHRCPLRLLRRMHNIILDFPRNGGMLVGAFR